MNYIIITSINPITEAVKKFSKIDGWHTVIIADTKSVRYDYENITFLDINDQEKLNFSSFETTPFKNYARKNLGYLYAIKNNANLIYDTDDDTFPYEDWSVQDFNCENTIQSSNFINPFEFFTEEKCWARGTPLSQINQKNQYSINFINSKIGVWQGIIDDDSDFDAIYRLTSNKHIKFDKDKKIAIDKNCYSVFNTQSTLWNKELNCLLYIPISVDFRFSDILRGYIAQKIMWEFNYKLGFHSPNTYQIRNQHDYFTDFLGEISMYQNVPKVIEILNSVIIDGKTIENSLIKIYNLLYQNRIVKETELENLNNWIKDYNNLKV
jgi:hypothetical protein